MNHLFLVWERSDWDSECFDMDGPEDPIGAVWHEQGKTKKSPGYWAAEAMGGPLPGYFSSCSEAEAAVEEYIQHEALAR